MMKSLFFRTGTLVVFVALVVLVLLMVARKEPDNVRAMGAISITEAMSGGVGDFEEALEIRDFSFPEDYGSHDEYKVEWWYFTGNLSDGKGGHFGYQFTIFRNAFSGDSLRKNAGMAAKQLYFAHFALTDVKNGKFYYSDKYARGVDGLAGAELLPLKVHVENWSITSDYSSGDFELPDFRVQAVADGYSIDLRLTPSKNLVKHGENGLSRKSNAAGNASYYYSFTRLVTMGEITVGGRRFYVEGLSWFDREWSTSALDSSQVGWDWFSMQLDNGYDLMYFMLRNYDGTLNFGKGTLVRPDGKGVYVSSDDVRFEVLKNWTANDGVSYPSAWSLMSEKHGLDLTIETRVSEQELRLLVRYYEGSVRVSGAYFGKKISGLGYVEMTGYAK